MPTPEFNAFIVAWTMNEYAALCAALRAAGFRVEQADGTDHIRLVVPFEQITAFAALCQRHLNAPVNYVDVQYPDRRTTVIIFRERVVHVTEQAQNDALRAWAIARGLPPEQADWATSF